MKVHIAVKGRFHAFDLARELHKRGALGRLLTTYPRREARRFGLPDEQVTTRLAQELRRRLRAKLPFQSESSRVNTYRRFDASTVRWLQPDADVFVGWSGACVNSLERAKSLGLRTVVERGSTHIAWARERLLQVFDDAGVPPRVAPWELVEREVAEYANADRIAIPSSFVEQTFLQRGVAKEKLVRIPYGVNLQAFEAEAGPSLDGVFRVVFVGAVGVRKGVLTLLEAFAQLRGNCELLLVGNVLDEIRPRLQHLPDNVRVLGSVPQSTLVEHYRSATVFALPSFEEGLAMVIPQAMAAGRAIVASHASGAGDLITEGVHGHLIDAGDVEALTQRLAQLQEHPDQAVEFGRAARKRVADGFSWDDYGDRCLRSYEELLRSERLPT